MFHFQTPSPSPPHPPFKKHQTQSNQPHSLGTIFHPSPFLRTSPKQIQNNFIKQAMPLSLKTMKSIDLFCASPASTAIVSSTEPQDTPRISRSSRPLHRLNSIFSYREPRLAPCTFELPFTPRLALFGREKGRRSSAERSMYELPFTPRAADLAVQKSRKSSAEHSSKSRNSMTGGSMMMMRRKSSADVYDLDSPPPISSRHLLGDTFDANQALTLVPSEPPVGSGDRLIRQDGCLKTSSLLNSQHTKMPPLAPRQSGTPRRLSFSGGGLCKASTDSPVLVPSASSPSHNQMVVLRVSIHCKGCERKLRKHLSNMDGVTSFSIDLATKKVTVVGTVTPLSVLMSISKVKNAQFWPSPPSSTTSSSSASSASSTSTMDFSY
ncbi:hypothetical protein Droror1_Dr00003314 [Drosera rotundifolia]